MYRIVLLTLAVILNNFTASAQGIWTQKANFGGGSAIEARAFSIGNYGYVGGPTADLWRYDPLNDVWTQMAAFIGPVRSSPVAFSIGTKGYLGTGGNYNDFYEYDAIANTWTQKANFGGSGREGALGISINGKGYIGTGGGYLGDWWEYDTTSNAWTQKATLAGPTRYHGGAFAINGKGYISTGFNGNFFNDLWEYDPIANSWTAKAPLPGSTRDRPVGLATATKGYILTGWTGSSPLNDAWEYNPVTNSWTALPAMPVPGRYNACGFTVGDKLYVGTGVGGASDWWEFGPDCSALAVSEATTCAGACDGDAEITSPDSAAVTSYLWSNGATTAEIFGLCAGTYTATVTDTSGCVSTISVDVIEPAAITATAAITQPACFGDADGSICAVTTASPATYLWATGDTASCLQNLAGGIYTVTITDSLGCSGVIPLTLTEPGQIILNFNFTNASCGFCTDGSAAAQLTGGVGPYSYLWSTGSTFAFANNLAPGFYTCCVTDANGCTACDSVGISAPIGFIELNAGEFIISPNPFSDELLVLTNALDISDNVVRVFDIAGREIALLSDRDKNSIRIATSTFPQGIYFLQIAGNSGSRTFKVVKE